MSEKIVNSDPSHRNKIHGEQDPHVEQINDDSFFSADS